MAKNEIPKISDFQSLGLCDGFAKVNGIFLEYLKMFIKARVPEYQLDGEECGHLLVSKEMS